MVDMVTEIYGCRYIEILDKDEKILIEVTATGDDRFENSFVYFHPNYTDFDDRGCYICFKKIIKTDFSDYTVYLICYSLNEKDVTSLDLKAALDRVLLFERLDLKVEQLKIGEFSHPY